jgi:tRNA nucleotidyltransferase (CCA-adding enzyme)
VGSTLLDRMSKLFTAAPVLAALPGTWVVGGAVRDLMLGSVPGDFDVVVEGDAIAVARRAAAELGGEVVVHERFGTATVRAGGFAFDVAAARRETYPRPGALPEVEPGATLADDLARRDFTVNTLALRLADGFVTGWPGAEEDLRARLLRVLHDASFRDDPTRLWRLARYRARLEFAVEPHTRELARVAVEGGALATVSGTRIGNELRLALAEDDPVAALDSAVELGLAPWLDVDGERIARALQILPPEGDRALAVLAAAARDPQPDLGFTAAAARAVTIALALRALDLDGAPPSVAARAFAAAPVEAVAATGTPEAERWLRTDRHRRLRITGQDLLAAGIPAGPELGRRLQAARDALVDGRVGDDAAAQLQVALASAP